MRGCAGDLHRPGGRGVGEECKIACPNLLFDGDIIGGCGVVCSVLTLAVGNNQGMGGVEFDKIYDIYFPWGSCASSVAHPATSWTWRT